MVLLASRTQSRTKTYNAQQWYYLWQSANRSYKNVIEIQLQQIRLYGVCREVTKMRVFHKQL